MQDCKYGSVCIFLHAATQFDRHFVEDAVFLKWAFMASVAKIRCSYVCGRGLGFQSDFIDHRGYFMSI